MNPFCGTVASLPLRMCQPENVFGVARCESSDLPRWNQVRDLANSEAGRTKYNDALNDIADQGGSGRLKKTCSRATSWKDLNHDEFLGPAECSALGSWHTTLCQRKCFRYSGSEKRPMAGLSKRFCGVL